MIDKKDYTIPLEFYRSEYGKKMRKFYDQGIRDYGGYQKMHAWSARGDHKTGTLTSSDRSVFLLELKEL